MGVPWLSEFIGEWHYHPQFEIHLIREGAGQLMAGDGLLPFEPGHVALIGSNLPHNWLSDLMPGERLVNRDVLCHVRPQAIRMLSSAFPETSGFEQVLGGRPMRWSFPGNRPVTSLMCWWGWATIRHPGVWPI